jgi:hypothetical protein
MINIVSIINKPIIIIIIPVIDHCMIVDKQLIDSL